MDGYFLQIDEAINERKTSPRVRFMLQNIVDLRKVIYDSTVCEHDVPVARIFDQLENIMNQF